MKLVLKEVASVLRCCTHVPDVLVKGWSTDTREVRPGELFFALRGPRHDGHDFVEEAFRKGAVAAVVERPLGGGVCLVVPSVLEALQQLANYARRRWGRVVVAVTGSAGKTTTKEAVAAVLGTRGPVGKSYGNYNNHIGVPLSLLRVPEEAWATVLELGMNHAGEIRQLTRIAEPQVGVVTLVGYAHIEHFDSVDAIALAKRELIEELGPDGLAVLNADDSRVSAFRQVHRGRCVTFGFSDNADVHADQYEVTREGTRFHVRGEGWVETRLLGRFAVRNLLAALAVGLEFGIPFGQAAQSLRELPLPPMRGERLEWRGATLINDCYNSNPDAVNAMLELLGELPARRRIAVLGEMLELGRWSETLHRQVGHWVVQRKVDLLLGVAGAARWIVEEAVRSGLNAASAWFVETPEEAGTLLRQLIEPGDLVLLKASRGVRLERAIEALLGET